MDYNSISDYVLVSLKLQRKKATILLCSPPQITTLRARWWGHRPISARHADGRDKFHRRGNEVHAARYGGGRRRSPTRRKGVAGAGAVQRRTTLGGARDGLLELGPYYATTEAAPIGLLHAHAVARVTVFGAEGGDR